MNNQEILSQAMQRINAGDGEGGKSLLLKLVDQQPDNTAAISLLGMLAQRSGEIDRAREWFCRGIAADPLDAALFVNLGFLELKSGNSDLGRQNLQQALKLESFTPQMAEAIQKTAYQTQDYDLASTASEVLLRHVPNENTLSRAADMAFMAGHWELAAKHLRKLLDYNDSQPVRYNLARALSELEQFEDAIEVFDPLVQGNSVEAGTYLTRGRLALNAKRYDEGRNFLEKALEKDPNLAEAYVTRCRYHVLEGNLDAAIEDADRAIAMNSRIIEAYLERAELKPFEKGDKAFKTLQALMEDSSLPLVDRSNAGFALGQMYQGIKDYDQAFGAYARGNELTAQNNKLANAVYDKSRAEEDIKRRIETFNAKALTQMPPVSDSTKPIFIVGLPRSGTSLLERMLAGHSKVSAGGELMAMRQLDDAFWPALKEHGTLQKTFEEEGDKWAERYLAALPDGAFATDKMPVNYFYLGLIHVLFPKARVLHIHRNPIDTCLSNYFRNFSKAYPHSTSLEDLAHFYHQYRHLMKHWSAVMSDQIMDVCYEDLVREPKAHVRAVLDFCDLDFEPACLETHKGKTQTFTMSAVQVRKPINTKGIERWRHYKKHLGPLIEALGIDEKA